MLRAGVAEGNIKMVSKETARVRAWREKNKKICPECSKRMIYKESKTCKFCIKKERDWEELTLKEAIYEKHHKSSAYALVRSRARSLTKKWKIPMVCMSCGYNKHVEICHVKPISEFAEDSTLSVINDKENLLVLCPNCHWEFDNKLISIEIFKNI